MVRLGAKSTRNVDRTGDSGNGLGFVDREPSVTGAHAPDHVGAWLREARETTGRDLRDIAAHLRIRYPYLLAIEEGRFDDLPGRAYAVGFIRSYAEHLGLDARQMVERFKSEVEVVTADENLKFPTPVPEGRFPGRSALLASALLAAALIGGWYYYQQRDAIELVRVPEPSAAPATVAAEKSPAFAGAGSQAAVAAENGPVPADAPGSDTTPDPETPATTARTPVAADPPPAPTGATRAAAIAEAPQIEAAAPTQVAAAPVAAAPDRPETARRVEPAVVGVTATTSPQPDEPVPAAPATAGVTGGEPASAETRMASLPPVPAIAPIEESAGRAYGLSNGDARVVLSASGDSWVQVRDANQNALLTRMLRAGDSYHVPNRSGLVMSVGNPSVLSVSIDDGPPFQLSSENVPISDIALDPEKLRDGTAIR